MKSASSTLLEHLRSSESESFTSRQLRNTFPNFSHGAISGFISRLKAVGAVTVVGTTREFGRLEEQLQVVNLSEVVIKENSTPSFGTGQNRRGVTTRERLANLLIAIAAEIEGMKVGLADYSTKELLSEVSRRMGEQK